MGTGVHGFRLQGAMSRRERPALASDAAATARYRVYRHRRGSVG